MTVYARDGAATKRSTRHRSPRLPEAVRPQPHRARRPVPAARRAAIAAGTPDLKLSTAPGDLLESFLRINGDLRQRNAQTLLDLAKKP